MVRIDFRIFSLLRQLNPMARRLSDYLSIAHDIECVLILSSFNLICAGIDLSMPNHRGLGSGPFSRVGFVGPSPNSEGKNQDREPTEELLCTPTHLAISFGYETRSAERTGGVTESAGLDASRRPADAQLVGCVLPRVGMCPNVRPRAECSDGPNQAASERNSTWKDDGTSPTLAPRARSSRTARRPSSP